MQLKSIRCPGCGGDVEPGADGVFVCPYCKTRIAVDWDENDVRKSVADAAAEVAKAEAARAQNEFVSKADKVNRLSLIRFLFGCLVVVLLISFGPRVLVENFTHSLDNQSAQYEDCVRTFDEVSDETFLAMLDAASQTVETSWGSELPVGWRWSDEPQAPLDSYLFLQYGENDLWFVFERDLVSEDSVLPVYQVAVISNVRLYEGVDISQYHGPVDVLSAGLFCVDDVRMYGFLRECDIWTTTGTIKERGDHRDVNAFLNAITEKEKGAA